MLGKLRSLFGIISSAQAKAGMKTVLSATEHGVLKNFKGIGVNAALNFVVPSAITLLTAPPQERGRELATNAGFFLLTAGMGPGRAFVAQMALQGASHSGDVIRMITSSNRSAMESRTMAMVPFSYSTAPMDIALASLQYSRQQMGQAYSMTGNEAAFMAARYLHR